MKKYFFIGKEKQNVTYFKKISDGVLCHHKFINKNSYYNVLEQICILFYKVFRRIKEITVFIVSTFSALTRTRVYRKKVFYSGTIIIIQKCLFNQLHILLASCFSTFKIPEFAPFLFSIEKNKINLFLILF